MTAASQLQVVELRDLSLWSEAHVWCCPEQHGTITAVFKNQIDWIPLSLGSVRPTQGRTLAVAQVSSERFQHILYAFLSIVVGPDGRRQACQHEHRFPSLGERWLPELQHCQHSAHSGAMDAHDYNPKSILCTEGLDRV